MAGKRSSSSPVDEALIRSLYADHGRALLAYASRLIGDGVAAGDVVQETLVNAWRNPGFFLHGRGSVRGWLFTLGARHCP